MASPNSKTNVIKEIYQALFKRFGPQNWWPADTAFEVIVGAVLTQNTNWKNVEKAIVNLKQENCLSIDRMQKISLEQLARMIKPAGYFNVKAKRLKNVVGFILERYNGSITAMHKQQTDVLREELLSINGVGPETADSILLYALNKSVFVVDAYTRRFMVRHNLVSAKAEYHDIQKLFSNALSDEKKCFNEYHALIVKLAKDFCKTVPQCEQCPLSKIHYNRLNRCQNCYRSFLRGEKRFGGKNASQETVCLSCKSQK